MGLGLQKLEAVGISKASCLKMRIPLRSGNRFFNTLSTSLLLKFKNENSFEEWKQKEPYNHHFHFPRLKMRIPLRSGNSFTYCYYSEVSSVQV